MKRTIESILIIFITSILGFYIHAQEKQNPSLKLRCNSLNIYFGLFDEFNIN